MKTYRDIHPSFFEHFETFSRRTRRACRTAVTKDGHRGVVAGVFQMANHCGGEEGKWSNVRRMCRAVKAISRKGVQLLACPEMCLQGYYTWIDGSAPEARTAGRSLADDARTSPQIRALRQAARESKMVLVFGFSEVGGRGGKKVYNSIGVIDADGKWLGSHRKNPLFPWPYEVEVFDEPPKHERLSVFKTRCATIGVTNCFDGSFPETVRGLRLAGAEMLVWCNAAVGSPKTGNNDRVPSSAAYGCANNMAVVAVNGAAENLSGGSCICAVGGVPLTILPTDAEACGVATVDLSATENWDLYRTRLSFHPKPQPPRPV